MNTRGHGSRIDKICLPACLYNKIREIKRTPFKCSDHKAVYAFIKFHKTKWGNSYWKLNEGLLENENYKKTIHNYWMGWQENKCTYSLFEWWELGKKKIKDISIKFSKTLAATERQELEGLYTQPECEENKNNTDNDIMVSIRDDIDKIENKKKRGIIIRSRQEYFEQDIDNVDIFKLAEEKRGVAKEFN